MDERTRWSQALAGQKPADVDPNKIWEFVSAEEPDLAVLDELAPANLVELELARAVLEELGEAQATPPAPANNTRWFVMALVPLVAALLLAIAFWPGSSPEDQLRGDTIELATPLQEGEALPRTAFRLSWEAQPGVDHVVEVFDDRLTPLYRSAPIRGGAILVPAEKLPLGGTVFWRLQLTTRDVTQTTELQKQEVSP